jgi:hypothetical protein
MQKSLWAMLLSFTLVACNGGGTTNPNTGYYNPTPYYTCQYIWDTWSGNYTYACFWVYYGVDGQSSLELDMVADIADGEAIMLEKTAQIYAEKFSLAYDVAYKMAKNVKHFDNLTERSIDDLADFAQKMYGVNPLDLVGAISAAQLGQYNQLNTLIENAAIDYRTSTQNMRSIIKALHNDALQAHGLKL